MKEAMKLGGVREEDAEDRIKRRQMIGCGNQLKKRQGEEDFVKSHFSVKGRVVLILISPFQSKVF